MELYGKKGLLVIGKVQVIFEGFKFCYWVLLCVGSVLVYVGIDNQFVIKLVFIGQIMCVIGIVKDVFYDYNGCLILFDDVKFY